MHSIHLFSIIHIDGSLKGYKVDDSFDNFKDLFFDKLWKTQT